MVSKGHSPTSLFEKAVVARQQFAPDNIQLYNPQIGALEIVAQRGFQGDFLDYFRTVRVTSMDVSHLRPESASRPVTPKVRSPQSRSTCGGSSSMDCPRFNVVTAWLPRSSSSTMCRPTNCVPPRTGRSFPARP